MKNFVKVFMKLLIFLCLTLVVIMADTNANGLNGFDLNGSLVPQKEIKPGGPPRDGIPSIDQPKFISGKQALKSLNPEDRAIVIESGNERKAYPISILNWHEIVNDQINSIPVVITFCPLCGTGIVFRSKVGKKKLTFGVSGLLYQSDVLMYDRESESLWSQLMNQAVSGPSKGKRLVVFPSLHTHLKSYLTKYPNTKVLSSNTGHTRDYKRTPYGDYNSNRQIYFPINHPDNRKHPKTWSLLVKYNHKAMIIAMDELKKASGRIETKFGEKSFSIEYDKGKQHFSCPKARGLSCMTGFWFALRTFYPQSQVFGAVPKK